MIQRFSFCALVMFGVVVGTTGLVRTPKLAIAEETDYQKLNVTELQKKVFSAVNKAMPAVVAIGNRGQIFSGVIVRKEGIILSAGHAVRPNRRFDVVLADGRQVKAVGLGSNQRVDIAMLKIIDEGVYPFVEMGHSSALVRNQPCVGISHPGRFDKNRGAVVRFGHVTNPVTTNQGMILSTSKIEPGDSGGALIDLDGKVIGIHSNIRRDEAENYAVPIDTYRKFWDDLSEAQWLEIDGQPSLPKLGFRGKSVEGKRGVEVLSVKPDGFAKKSGMLKDDVVVKINGESVNTAGQIYGKMIELRQNGVYQFKVAALRAGKTVEFKFDVTPEVPRPVAYAEMTNFARHFKTLEEKLDDHAFPVQSKVAGETKKVIATRISNAGRIYLISKSSRVGDEPKVTLPGGKKVKATVVSRDRKNDLVLLTAALPKVTPTVDESGIHRTGLISLDQSFGDLQELRGKFLLSPDPKGRGEVSVWGSRYFNVPRTRVSGGYLGVQLNSRQGKVVFQRVMSGAARKAGVETGDVLLRFNDRNFTSRRQVTNFLREQDPNSTIKAVLVRDGEEKTVEIVLGSPPQQTGHVADNLINGKSARRDGFSLAIAHDAELDPDECGGPVFDLSGNFLGINMARYSRTSCYVLPQTILKKFVDQAPNTKR